MFLRQKDGRAVKRQRFGVGAEAEGEADGFSGVGEEGGAVEVVGCRCAELA